MVIWRTSKEGYEYRRGRSMMNGKFFTLSNNPNPKRMKKTKTYTNMFGDETSADPYFCCFDKEDRRIRKLAMEEEASRIIEDPV